MIHSGSLLPIAIQTCKNFAKTIQDGVIRLNESRTWKAYQHGERTHDSVFLEPPDVQALVGTELDCAAWVGREIFYYKLDGRCYSITCLCLIMALGARTVAPRANLCHSQ